MSLKSLIEKMDSIITEGTKETKTGRIHKAEPGGYGRKDDEDDEGKKVQPQVKRGRGRPTKTGAHTQSPEEKEKQAKREKAGKDLQSFMVGNLPGGKAPGKKGQVHKIKDDVNESEQDVTEATKETPTGKVHKAEPGGYGRKDDEDSDGKKVQPQVKRGRGRPKKDADSDTGEVKKWDTDKLSSWIIGNKPKSLPGKASVKHKLKDWMEHVEREMIVESMVHEGRMADVDILMQELAAGNADIYDVMNNPTTPEERYASKILQGMYDDVVIDSGLHPDDDFEEIINMMGDRLANEYGKELDEIALDPSQVAISAVKAPGAAQPQANTQQQQQTGQQQTGQQQTGQQQCMQQQSGTQQPAMGASVIDFKNPNDPLKAALQQAVKNKTVTALGETEVEEAAPKGWEGTVKAMKKHKEIDNPWALAHYMKGKGFKSHKKESVSEGYDPEKLKSILNDYPYETKALDEGWGMHESLYQALCDHYWKEGRIPRDIMYGPADSLKAHVEQCYLQDKEPLMGEGAVGAALGGVAGAALGKTPQAAMTGANLGSAVQDAVTTEGDRELAALKVNLPAVTRKQQGMSPLSLSDVGTTDKYKVGDKSYSIDDEPIARGTAKVTGQNLETLPESELEASLRGSVDNMEEDYMNESKIKNKKQGVSEGTNNINALVQKLGDTETLVHQTDGYKRKMLMKKRDELESRIGAMPGGKEALRQWASDYDKSTKMEGVAEEQEVEESGLQAYLGNKKYGKEGMDALRKAGREGAGKEKMSKLRAKFDKKDAQMESWENQLSTLLNEGMTITTSTGNEGASDSVSISATDADAQTLMKMLQNSGLMRGQSSSMSTEPQGDDHASVTVEPVSADEVMGTLEPGDDGGEEAMGFLKRMLGARSEHSHSEPTDGEQGDYEEEKVDEMHNETASSGDAQMSPVPEEEEMEEGNAFSGAVAKAKADGIQPGEKIKVGGKEYPVKEEEMEEGNKFTGNLAKARAAGKKEADLDGDGDMEKVKEDEWQGTAETDMATAVSQKANGEEDAETEKETAMSEGEDTCNECGMYESKCSCEHNEEEKLDEWANSPNDSDEKFLADLTFMTKTLSGGLNNMKQDQTVLPNTRVKTQGETKHPDLTLGELIRKLQNIN